MGKRIVCGSCETELEAGDGPQGGTKFVTCTSCVIKKNPGAKHPPLVDPEGKIIKSTPGQLQKDAKSMQQIEHLQKAMGGTGVEVKISAEYIMIDGGVAVSFQFAIPPAIKFDFGLTEQQVREHLNIMVKIREKAEKQKELRDKKKLQDKEGDWPTIGKFGKD